MIKATLVLLLISTSVFAQEYGKDVRVLETRSGGQAGSDLDGKIVLELVNKLLVETPGPIKQTIDEYRSYQKEFGCCAMLNVPPDLVVMESGRGGWFFSSGRYRAIITWTDAGSGMITYPIMALDISQEASIEEGEKTTTLTTKVVGFKNFIGDKGKSESRLPKPPWQSTSGEQITDYQKDDAPSIADEDHILSKEDAGMMFNLTLEKWKQNLKEGKALEVMDYAVTSEKEFTMYVRQEQGLLAVTPAYHSDELKPWKLTVSLIFDISPFKEKKWHWTESDIKDFFTVVMNEMQPEYSVIGHIERKSLALPIAIQFSVFRKGEFPLIDAINEEGKGCFITCLNPSR